MDTQFIKVYHALKNDILRVAFSFTKNLTDAEDITQEVFVKLYENFAKFEDEEYMKKWCVKVTINKCKNLFFSAWKKKISYITEKEENKSYESFTDNSNNVLDAILKLAKKYRIVIILYYYEGYKIKEIASILKVNESTIKTRLQRAKNQLQNILNEEGKND